jgi:hypothetical protein
MIPIGYSGTMGGILIRERNLKSKMSCQTPFNNVRTYSMYDLRGFEQQLQR